MPDYGVAFVIFVASAAVSRLALRWAFRTAQRAGRTELGFIRFGGYQAIIGLLAACVALISLVVGFVEL